MEIVNILFLLGIFVAFFSIGFPLYGLDRNFKIDSLFISNQLIFNIILQLNLILFLSLLNISLKQILYVYFSYLTLTFIFFVKKNLIFVLLNKKEIIFFCFSIFLCFVLLIDIANHPHLGWDSQKVWFYKTLNFYNGGTIESLNVLPAKDDGGNYPYLGSLLWSLYWKISFYSEEYTGRLLYVFLYIISLFLIVEKLNTSLIKKMIFLIILISLSYKYRYFDGDQDIIIFILISFLSVIVHNIYKTKNGKRLDSQIFLLILICNLLIWTKQEGLIYSFIIVFILFFFSKIDLKKKILLFGLLLFLVSFKLLIYKFYSLDSLTNSCCWSDLSLNSIFTKLLDIERTLSISQFFIYGLLETYFFILALISLFFSCFIKNQIKKDIYLCVYVFTFLNFGFLFMVYMLTSIDLIFMLKTGLHRLLFATSPIYLLIFIEYFNSQKFKN